MQKFQKENSKAAIKKEQTCQDHVEPPGSLQALHRRWHGLQGRASLTVSQLRGEDVLGSNEELFPEVCSLRWAIGKQLEHAFHHLLRVLGH